MGFFRRKKKESEWSGIYDDDLGFDPSEADENPDPDDEIDKLRGTVDRGPCMFCGKNDCMVEQGGVCFICEKCGESIDEDGYYRWLAGYDVSFDDGNTWDELY